MIKSLYIHPDLKTVFHIQLQSPDEYSLMDIFLYKMLLALHYHTVVWWGRGKMVQSQQQRLWEAQILGVRELAEQTHLLGTLGKLLYPFPGPRDPCHLEPVLSLLYWLRPSDVTVSSVSCTEMAPSWLKGSYR